MKFLATIIAFPLNLLPRSVRAALGSAIGLFFFHVLRFRRKIVLENLEIAYGDKLTPEQRYQIARENYRHYGRTLVEVCTSFSWTPKDFKEEVALEGWEHVENVVAQKCGAFIITLHLGNWEYSIHAFASLGLPIDIVVKHARNKFAETLLQWYRARTGARILLESGTARDVLKSLSDGRFVAFVIDQFMGAPIGLPVKFFGKTAGTAAALALITEKKEVPTLVAYSYRDEKNQIHLAFESLESIPLTSTNKDERLFEKTQFYNDVLEKIVRKHPEQWLWIHRRWKKYLGEPRWKIPRAFAPAALLFFLVACASAPQKGPTGIDLPPDPVVQTPTFIEPKPVEITTSVILPSPDASPAPVSTPKPVAVETKKKKTKKVAVPAPTPEPEKMLFEPFPKERIPFKVGEKLVFDLTWMALPAGKATLEVRDGGTVNGRPTLLFWGNALSSKLVDAIYHIDNTIESFVDAEGLIPYKYLLHQVESKQNKESKVFLDHVGKKAFFWSKRVSQKMGDQEINREDAFVPKSQDMFSGFFYLRTLPYQLNKKESFGVYENNQNMVVDVLPVANEMVRTRVGYFKCWKLLLTVTLNNILKPTGDIFMWVSDDPHRYLVKFDAKVKVGSIYGSLISLREAN